MGLLEKYKKSEVTIKKEKFESKFDYAEFSKKDKENLIELEKKALYTGTLLRENLKELGDVFYEAQLIFSNNKNGMFGKWYEVLGYKKDFVYLCLDRKNLSLQFATKEIYKLPDRAIKDIKKISEKDEELVFEILESEDPKSKIKEVKENLLKKSEKAVEEENPKKQELTKRFKNLAALMNKKQFSEETLAKIEKLLITFEKELA